MHNISYDIILSILDFMRLDDVQTLRDAFSCGKRYASLVELVENYIGRNSHRRILPSNILFPVVFRNTEYEFSGCTFYPARQLLRVTDIALETGIGPVTRDFTGWNLSWEMENTDNSDPGKPHRWRWMWKPIAESIGQTDAERSGPDSFSLLMADDPSRFKSLQISFSTFLSFEHGSPLSVFRTPWSGTSVQILRTINPTDRRWFFNNLEQFRPIFSCLDDLETLILEPPSNYYYFSESWWYNDTGENSMVTQPNSEGLYPFEQLSRVLSTLPKLTAVHISIPVQHQGLFDDIQVINDIIDAIPMLKALTISEIPPRTRFRLQHIKFEEALSLQSLQILCLDVPLTFQKEFRPGIFEYEIAQASSVLVDDVTQHLKEFAASRDFANLCIRILVGDSIRVPGTRDRLFIWDTVTMEHVWHTTSDRDIAHVQQEHSYIWDPLDEYPKPYLVDNFEYL